MPWRTAWKFPSATRQKGALMCLIYPASQGNGGFLCSCQQTKAAQFDRESKGAIVTHINLIQGMQQKGAKKLGWAQPGFEPAMTVLKRVH